MREETKLPRVPQRTTPGFAFPPLERALQDCLARRKFGQKETEVVIDFFGSKPPQCVYCGNSEVQRWDHIVPISRGGETVLGNMVPACQVCDDSKGARLFEDWIMSDAPRSPKSRGIQAADRRLDRIKKYMQHFSYEPESLRDRLDDPEWERLNSIRSKLQDLRKEVDALIESYRARTGNT